MRLSYRGFIWLATIICLPCAYAIYIHLSMARSILYMSDEVTFQFDPNFSPSFCSEITTWLQTYRRTFQEHIYDELQKEFNAIATITAQMRRTKPLITIKAVNPCLRFNNDMVVADNGQVLITDLFDVSVYNELPIVCVYNLQQQSKIITNSANISLLIFLAYEAGKRFRIAWHNETQIWLYDKEKPFWCMLIDSQTLFTNDSLKKYCAVVAAIENKKIKIKKGQLLVADMRFADQIIVYGTKGVEDEAA